MNWWGCTHKNFILTNTVHFFEKVVPDYIIIIADDHVLGMNKNHGSASLTYCIESGSKAKSHLLLFTSWIALPVLTLVANRVDSQNVFKCPDQFCQIG